MSDYFRVATTPVARKQYVCVACGWLIPAGEKHTAQTGVYDGRSFSNRFHTECWTAELDDGFITGDIPVPERFQAEAKAYWDAKRAAALATPPSPAPATSMENQQ